MFENRVMVRACDLAVLVPVPSALGFCSIAHRTRTQLMAKPCPSLSSVPVCHYPIFLISFTLPRVASAFEDFLILLSVSSPLGVSGSHVICLPSFQDNFSSASCSESGLLP